MIKILIFTIALLGIAVAGIAIKMLLKKGETFKKSCGSVDPKTGERISCTCGTDKLEYCDNSQKS